MSSSSKEWLHIQTILKTLKTEARSAKISFIYSLPTLTGNPRMQTGSITVDKGYRCIVDFEGLEAAVAIQKMHTTPLTKIAEFPAISVDFSLQQEHVVDVASVLQWMAGLDAPRTAPISSKPTISSGITAVRKAVTLDPASQKKEWYSPIALRRDVAEVLAHLYGPEMAQVKADELANRHSPATHPEAFVDASHAHIAFLLGDRRAKSLMEPVHYHVLTKRTGTR